MADSRDFILGIVIGSVIGAAAALVLAPAAGSETRRVLRSRADEARARSAEMANQARDRASEVGRQVQDRVQDVTGEARHRITDLREASHAPVDWAEQQREAVLRAWEAGRQAYAEKADAMRSEEPARAPGQEADNSPVVADSSAPAASEAA